MSAALDHEGFETECAHDPPAVSLSCEAPFRAALVRWRGANHHQLTVVVKVSFRLVAGCAVLASDADPIVFREVHADGDPERSLLHPSDIAPFKRAPEILVVGHAHAAGADPVASISCRVRIATVDKSLEAWAPRRLRGDDIELLEPARRLPLTFEAAAGGRDTENPVGAAALVADGEPQALPSLVPRGFIPRAGSPLPSIGLGPIAETWPARQRRLRKVDRAWLSAPTESPLPSGFDARYFSAAPADQQLVQPIRADERLILEGLSAGAERLETCLPGIAPKLMVAEGFGEAPLLVADTLLLDTDRAVVTVTYRARLPIPEHGRLRLRIVASRLGREVSLEGCDTVEIEALRFGPGLTLAARVSTLSLPVPEYTADDPSERDEDPAETGEFAAAARPESGFFRSVSEADAVTDPDPVAHERGAAPLRARNPSHPGPSEPEQAFSGWRRQRLLSMISCDSGAERRARRAPEFKATLTSIDEGLSERHLDGELNAPLLALLSGVEPVGAQGVRRAVRRCFDDPWNLESPVCVARGMLRPSFDETQSLSLLVRLLSPHASKDKPLELALERARQMLQQGMGIGAFRPAALIHELHAASARLSFGAHELSGALLAAQLQSRCYQQSLLFGEPQVRADLTLDDGASYPCYFPARDAAELPQMAEFEVVSLVEVRPREDAGEPHQEALRCLALARLLRDAP